MKFKFFLILILFSSQIVSKPIYKKNGLEVLSYELKKEDFASYIVGTVINKSKKTYKTITIEFKLYDSSGAVIGEALDTIEDLGPEEKWNFKAIVLEENVAKIILKRINIYDF